MNISRLFAVVALVLLIGSPMLQAQKSIGPALNPPNSGSGGGAAAGGSGIYVPPGLNPGDQYHLAFVTSGERNAASTDITVYNQFVQDQAALNPAITGTDQGVLWFAIGSTPSVPANVNAAASAPIYLFDGSKLADGHNDLYDGSIDTLFQIDQFQNTIVDNRIWTGALPFGQNGGGIELGMNIPGTGNNTVTNTSWITDWNEGRNTPHRMYALSEVLTVPSVVTPDSVTVVVGNYTSGQLEDVYESDDIYLCYNRGAAFAPTLPSIWLIFEGTLPSDNPSAIKVTLEAQVNDAGIDQGIEMFNFVTGAYEVVDTRDASINVDSVADVDLTGDVTRFVEPGTGLVRTKVTYIDDGTGFFINWRACIDQFVWTPN